MTNIEMDVARSTIRANRAVANSLEEIDWEKRRYEIAKGILPYCAETARDILKSGQRLEGSKGKTVMQVCAESAVYYADALIAELRKEASE